MNSERMATNLNRIACVLKTNGLITDGSRRMLHEAASYVESCPEETWELVVYPDNPIVFTKAESDERVRPDIFCEIVKSDTDDYPLTHLRLVLRVWSIRRGLSYRPDWDSSHIIKKLDENYSIDRVISRCHYDTCDKSQYAPFYHLQLHGKPIDNELYWFPHTIELPRFPSPPIDLILACELVVATFFPRKYQQLMEKGEWVNIIKESESYLLDKYFERCQSYLDINPRNVSLLDCLCTQPF